MKIAYKVGDNAEPCGTPASKGMGGPMWCPICILACLFFTKLFKNLVIGSGKLNWMILKLKACMPNLIEGFSNVLQYYVTLISLCDMVGYCLVNGCDGSVCTFIIPESVL